MSVPIKNQEPIVFTAGDTLSFQRYLQSYPASQGWLLQYELRGDPLQIQFQSVASGDSHLVTVAANVTVNWTAGQYEMAGYAVNAGTGERERIYLNNLTINPNLVDSTTPLVTTTHAQRMITLIEAVQEGKATHDIIESEVEQTRIKRLSPKELREEYNYWLQIRSVEVKVANSKAGRSNGRNRYTVFRDPQGANVGQFGAMPPIFPYGGSYE